MEKIGLVLGGGGSRGAYQAGAICALNEIGFKADIVTGTSVGAINAFVYAQQDIAIQQEVWQKISYRQVVKHKFKWKNKAREILCVAPWKGGFELSPLKRLLKKYINEQKLRSSNIKFGLVYTGPFTKYMPTSIDEMEEGKVADYIIASCSARPFLKKSLVNGQKCKDGSYCDNLPMDFASQLGARKIIAIEIMAGLRKQIKNKDTKFLILRPSKKLGFFLNFEKENLKEMYQLGYNDTIARREEILKFLKS